MKDGSFEWKKKIMSGANFLALLAAKDIPNKAIEEGRSLPPTEVDNGCYKVDYKLWLAEWYIGYFEYTEYGTLIGGSGVNIKLDEWKYVMDHIDDIRCAIGVRNVSPVKRRADGSKKVNITMYKWKWMMGKKKVSESKMYYYCEKTCRSYGESPEHTPVKGKDFPDDKDVQLVVDTMSASPPDILLLLRQCFTHFLRECVTVISKEKCPGCKVDALSQKDHCGQGGCLSPQKEIFSMYTREAKKHVDMKKVGDAMDAVNEFLGVETPHSEVRELLPKICKTFFSTEMCKVMLEDKSFDNIDSMIYVLLFEQT